MEKKNIMKGDISRREWSVSLVIFPMVSKKLLRDFCPDLCVCNSPVQCYAWLLSLQIEVLSGEKIMTSP